MKFFEWVDDEDSSQGFEYFSDGMLRVNDGDYCSVPREIMIELAHFILRIHTHSTWSNE